MWKWLERWHVEAESHALEPRQACAKQDVERRFAEGTASPLEKSLRGIVDLLIETGLVYGTRRMVKRS